MKTTRQKLKKIPGVPGLLRHESGVYYMRRKIKGKIFNESLETSDRKMADRRLIDRTNQILNPPLLPPPVPTVAEVCEQFLAGGAAKKEATIANYEWVIGGLRENFPKFNAPINTVLVSDIKTYFGTLNHLKPRSFNDATLIASQIFELAVADEHIPRNTVRATPNLKKKVTRERERIPSMKEYQAIVDHIRNRPFSDTAELSADFITFYTLFAVGEAEASALDWSDVHWNEKRVYFKRLKTSEHFYVPFLPWNTAFLTLLWEKAEKPTHGPVFSVRSAKQAIINACMRLELFDEEALKKDIKRPAFSPRDFRKTGVEMMRTNGLEDTYISKYQGHVDDTSLVKRVYRFTKSKSDEENEQRMLTMLARR